MAVATASAPSGFATSTSSFRVSQSHPSQPMGTTSYSDSALTQLPHIDFKFDDLRRRMAEFTIKFDTFIEQGRKRVLQERNEFRGRLSELNEEQRSSTTQIATLQSTLSTHAHVLSRESLEKREMQTQIRELEAHATNQRAQREKLRTAIGQTQAAIEAKLAAQREYAAKMEGQSRMNGPELNFWETYLGCRIEGAGGEDMVRVVYVFPADSGSKSSTRTTEQQPGRTSPCEREACFELQVPETGGGGYQVVYMEPKLDPVKVDRVVAKLNESRDVATLLKGMRNLFADVMRGKMVVR